MHSRIPLPEWVDRRRAPQPVRVRFTAAAVACLSAEAQQPVLVVLRCCHGYQRELLVSREALALAVPVRGVDGTALPLPLAACHTEWAAVGCPLGCPLEWAALWQAYSDYRGRGTGMCP